jgi:hypothetical protein
MMDRRVLLGAGVAVLAVVAFLALRGPAEKQAAKVVDTTLDQLTAQLPPGTTMTHGATELNPLTQSVTVHDVLFSKPDHSTVAADTLTLTGVNLLACRDVFDVNAYPDGKPAWTDRRVLVAAASIDNLKTSNGKVVVTLAHAALQGLSGHPFNEPPTGANRRRPGFGAEAALDFKLDDMTAAGLTVVTEGQQTNNISVGSVELNRYDGGKLAAFILRDLVVDTRGAANNRKPMLAKLSSVELKGLNAAGVLQATAAGGHADGSAYSSMTYTRMGMAGLDVRVTQGPVITLDDMHADQELPGADGARNGKLTLTALRLDLGDTPVPASADPAIAAFGMRAITLDITGAGHTVTGGVSDVTEEFIFRDLGTLRLKGAFSGWVQPAPQDAKGAAQALMNTVLDHARIDWQDSSLTDRIFKVAAVQMHSTADTVRAQLALPLVALGVLVPDQPDAVDQVTAFLKAPQSLTITMNPPQKVTFGEIGRAPANERAHLLGLHVTANQAP